MIYMEIEKNNLKEYKLGELKKPKNTLKRT